MSNVTEHPAPPFLPPAPDPDAPPRLPPQPAPHPTFCCALWRPPCRAPAPPPPAALVPLAALVLTGLRTPAALRDLSGPAGGAAVRAGQVAQRVGVAQADENEGGDGDQRGG